MVAGPNGSGKSTLIAALRADPLAQLPGLYVNADDLQRERGLADSLVAQKLATELRVQAIAQKADVMYETVMSHPAKLAELQLARAAGYHVTVHLVATDDPAINEERVQARVGAGGHAVPPERIRTRYARTLALAPLAIGWAHQAVVFDNTHGGDTGRGLAVQAALANGRLELVTDAPAAWVLRLATGMDEKARALQALSQDAVVEPAQLRRSTCTGPIVALDAHHVLQQAKSRGVQVLHERILLGARAQTLVVGSRCRIRYRDGVAEIDFPGDAAPPKPGRTH